MSEFILKRVPLLWFSVIVFFNPCDLKIVRYLRVICYDSLTVTVYQYVYTKFHTDDCRRWERYQVFAFVNLIFPYYHGPKSCQEIMKLWNFLRKCFMYFTKLTQLLWQRLVRKLLREYSGIIEGILLGKTIRAWIYSRFMSNNVLK